MYIHSAMMLVIGYLIGSFAMFFSIRSESDPRIRLIELPLGIFIGPLMMVIMPIIQLCQWIKKEW